MPSPEMSGYTELTLYDITPADLVDRALLDAEAKLPTWEAKVGAIEVVLIEAMALQIAETVYAINRVPNGIIDILAQLYGVNRSLGTPGNTTITFTTDKSCPAIPIGTVCSYDAQEGTYTLTTTASGAVDTGTGLCTVPARVDQPGDTLNGTPVGTELGLMSDLPCVNQATLATEISGGAPEETEDEWRERFTNVLDRISATLVLPNQFTAAALAQPGIGQATTIDNFDPNAGAHPNGGHVTVAVLDESGAALTTQAKTELHDLLDAQCEANLAVHIVDPTFTNVTVNVVVHPLPGFLAATVIANATAAIAGYLDSASWGWSTVVRRNEIIARADTAEGVDYVVDVTAPAADVNLTGTAPIPRATITVTIG